VTVDGILLTRLTVVSDGTAATSVTVPVAAPEPVTAGGLTATEAREAEIQLLTRAGSEASGRVECESVATMEKASPIVPATGTVNEPSLAALALIVAAVRV